MNSESVFRIIFWSQILFIILFNRLLPAFRAKKTGTKLAPDHEAIANEGKFLFILRVVGGIFVGAAIVIYSFFPSIAARLQMALPLGVRWAGVFLSTISLIFWTYSQEVLNKNWSTNVKIQKEHLIITSGPYAVMRHPIYSAMFLWSIGLSLYTAHLLFMLLTLFTIVWTPSRVEKEERTLINHFGQAYRDYMKKTGRFLPKIRQN